MKKPLHCDVKVSKESSFETFFTRIVCTENGIAGQIFIGFFKFKNRGTLRNFGKLFAKTACLNLLRPRRRSHVTSRQTSRSRSRSTSRSAAIWRFGAVR